MGRAMETRSTRYTEIGLIAAIALLVAIGGRVLLANLQQYKIAAALVIAMLILATLANVRRAYVGDPLQMRVGVTKHLAYLAAAVLALVAILAPAKWVYGSTIAAMEVALVFDIITLAARPAAGGGRP